MSSELFLLHVIIWQFIVVGIIVCRDNDYTNQRYFNTLKCF